MVGLGLFVGLGIYEYLPVATDDLVGGHGGDPGLLLAEEHQQAPG
jgi:hypothetical protein